ncbi:GntR family transcriptional regulator [Streptomyces sp. NPDC057694]|uniref:GntR family transcriptional regulator n=1 Tax=Streptomyces sp. NPDC057694 TaxID=3346216 RepID=UPI0036B1CAFE
MTEPDVPTPRMGKAVEAAYTTLRQRIAGGRYTASGKLPSERVLASELGVSRGTLRGALRALTADGAVAPAPQSGWQVLATPLGEPPHTLVSFTEMAESRGLTPRTEILGRTARPATLDEADQLRIAPGPVLDLRRLRGLGESPVCVDHNVIALSRVPGLAEVDLTDRSLYAEMTRRGTHPYRSDFSVHAEAADDTTAARLHLDAGAPILVGLEICTDAAGKPLLLGRSMYRMDAYRFKATLFRRT